MVSKIIKICKLTYIGFSFYFTFFVILNNCRLTSKYIKKSLKTFLNYINLRWKHAKKYSSWQLKVLSIISMRSLACFIELSFCVFILIFFFVLPILFSLTPTPPTSRGTLESQFKNNYTFLKARQEVRNNFYLVFYWYSCS